MAQMNFPMKEKQTHRHREKILGCQGGGGVGEGWTGVLGLVDVNYMYRMDKQGPTVLHRELYSISCDKP